MEIVIEEYGAVKILRFDGLIDTLTAADAEAAIQEQISAGATQLLLNFEKLSYINSTGLRVILVVAKELKRREGQLQICSLCEPVREVFDMTGFSTILQIEESEAQALAGFGH